MKYKRTLCMANASRFHTQAKNTALRIGLVMSDPSVTALKLIIFCHDILQAGKLHYYTSTIKQIKLCDASLLKA